MFKTVAALFFATSSVGIYATDEAISTAFLNYDLPLLHSTNTINLYKEAAGKPLLIINTASHCGFTKQFEGLEALHQQYKDQGLFVVGFASNDFNQEAKSEEEAERVCRQNFGVTFIMIAPSYVKGERANPIFRELNKRTQEPSWNFNKYLVDSKGKVLEQFSARVKPNSEKLTNAIEALL